MPPSLQALNEQQQAAVISENKRLLVLAGAGSGKTRTLLQKIIYLIEEKKVSPNQILAITFTKNAANEMLDRLILAADPSGQYANMLADRQLNESEQHFQRRLFAQKYKWIHKLTVRTFHSFCYSIMRNFGVQEFDNRFKIIGDGKLSQPGLTKFAANETAFEVFHKLLISQCEDNQYLLDLKRYLLDYLVDRIHAHPSRKLNLYPDGRIYTSLNGTRVRSKSEQYIADWLFRHNIVFEYEPNVNFRDFNFSPDFYIPDANLYLEHLSELSAPMQHKEQQFSIANKLLVKTFEHQTKDSALFNLVLERIVKNRLPANYAYQSALSFEEEFRFYHKEVRDFIQMLMRVTDMIKAEAHELKVLQAKAQKDPHERVRMFYQLAIPLIQAYKSYCTNKSYLDFNDMISRTIALFENHEEIAEKFRKKYRYILVDEFQDVNNLQVELIRLLITEESQLFCVGDDWQSIYGFRGSNVDYIIHFQKHFPQAHTIKLSLNYRSTENIVGASNEVIKHNKYKVEKRLRSSKKTNSKIHIHAGQNEEENVDYVVREVKKLKKRKRLYQR